MTAFTALAQENRLLRAQLKKATAAHYRAQLAESQCNAAQFSDQMYCDCGNVWDMNDPCPPQCRKRPPAGPCMVVPVAAIKRALRSLELFAYDTPDGRSSAHELQDLLGSQKPAPDATTKGGL